MTIYHVSFEFEFEPLGVMLIGEAEIEDDGESYPEVTSLYAELDGCKIRIGDKLYEALAQEAIEIYKVDGGFNPFLSEV